jgi:multidrug efflux pump subunit AcrA (membrane-fusion protein)
MIEVLMLFLNKYKYWIIALSLSIAGAAFLINKKLNKPVKTIEIVESSIVQAIYGQGVVRHEEIYNLKSGITSGIEQVFVKEGDLVKKGDILVKVEGNFFRAPFDGMVMSLPSKKRETIYSQSIILVMVNLKSGYIEISLEQKSFMQVEKDQKVRISFEGMRDSLFYGKVVSKYSQGNQFLVRVAVDLPDIFFPNMSLDCAIILNEKPKALIVPYLAVANGKIKKVEANKTKEINVKLGLIDEEKIEIISSELKAGDKVVIP